jgi:hypothetical protein
MGLYGMQADAKQTGDFAITGSARNLCQNFLFPRCQAVDFIMLDLLSFLSRKKGLADDFSRIPQLTAGNCPNAFR